VWDALLLKGWTKRQMLDVLPIAFSSDAAVLQMWKQHSFTPIVGQLLSLPPHLRLTFHGYMLLGMFPENPKNHQVMYDAVLHHLQQRCVFSGVPIEDSFAKGAEPKKRKVAVMVNSILEDTKGLPLPICSKQCPANCGMCPICTVPGLQVFNRPCYIGAVTRLYRRYDYRHTTYKLLPNTISIYNL
jgi:hypothetical protein